MTHKIRTTMQPTVDLEVEDAEYLDLKRQGLIAVDDEQASTDTQAAADNPATPDQAQALAPAAPSKAAKPATNKEG